MRKQLYAFLFVMLSILLAYSFWPQKKTALIGKADKIVVEKHARRMTLKRAGFPLKIYDISLGRQSVGKKTEEGDYKTPEGVYFIDRRNSSSRFYKSLHISYPNESDIKQARAKGLSPGRDIMVHGLPRVLSFLGRLHLYYDWTAGCIAVTNEEMDEIWEAVPDGTAIEILP